MKSDSNTESTIEREAKKKRVITKQKAKKVQNTLLIKWLYRYIQKSEMKTSLNY